MLQEPRQALKALSLAEDRYASTSPATDPGYWLADAPASTIPLRRVRILINLGQTEGVMAALEESQQLYEAQWPQAKGRGLAELQPRQAALALALEEQELFVEALEASIDAAKQSGSRYALAMVKQLLRQGKVATGACQGASACLAIEVLPVRCDGSQLLTKVQLCCSLVS